MKYTIGLHGCDAETIFDIDLTNTEKAVLDRVAELAKNTSTYACMPTMTIEPAKDDAAAATDKRWRRKESAVKRVVGYFALQILGGLCLSLGWNVDTDSIPCWRFVAAWVAGTFLIEASARFCSANKAHKAN